MEPNRIEFHKVFGEFRDLRKNFVVLVTVCSMLLIYFIGLVFTRRADRQDTQKVRKYNVAIHFLFRKDKETRHLNKCNLKKISSTA